MEGAGVVRKWIVCIQSDHDRKLKVRFNFNSHNNTFPMANFQVRFKRCFLTSGGFNDKSLPGEFTISEFSRSVLVNADHLMFEGTRDEFVNDIISSFPMRSDDINHVKGHLCSLIADEVRKAYSRGCTLGTCEIHIEYEVFVRESDDLQALFERHLVESLCASRMWDQFLFPKPSEVQRTTSVFVWEGGEEEEVEDCAVCMEKYVVGSSKVVRLPCRHVFHQACIYGWIGVNSSCPLCRLKV